LGDEICGVSVCLFGRLLWLLVKEESAFAGAQATPRLATRSFSPVQGIKLRLARKRYKDTVYIKLFKLFL